ATKEKIKSTVDQFLSTVTSNTGPKRFHVTLRIGSKEFGVSVKCTPDGDTSVLTAFCDNEQLTLDHWKGASPEAFLNHDWVGANVLQVVPSKVTEEQVQQMLNQQPTCFVSCYNGTVFKKTYLDARELAREFVTVIEIYQPQHSATASLPGIEETVHAAWNSVIVGIMNRAWDTLCSVHVVRAEGGPKAITSYEKSQMTNAIRDAFGNCDVSTLARRAEWLTLHIKKWLGVVCAPYLQRILVHDDAQQIIREVSAVSAQLNVLKPFMDAVFWSMDSDQLRNASDTNRRPFISDAITAGARDQLYQPCFDHIAKAALDGVARCRTQASLIGSVVAENYFTALKAIFTNPEYIKHIVSPCQAAGTDHFSINSQEVIARVRSGEIPPHEYIAHVLRAVKVERDIAEALTYSFDTTLGQSFFCAYVGKDQSDASALMREALETETLGIASLFTQLTATSVDAADDSQRSKLEALAIHLGGANLPVPTTSSLPFKLIPSGSYDDVAKAVIRSAVEHLFDSVHNEFDTAVAAEEQKQQEATTGQEPSSAGSTSAILKNYIVTMTETQQRLFSIVTALETVLKVESPFLQLLPGANSNAVWGKNILLAICPSLIRGIGEGIASSLKKRALFTSKADHNAVISKEVEVCIATFIDFGCRGTIKDANVEAMMADALAVGKYVSAKDTLQLELQNRCAKRLLAKPSASELESSTINACKRIFGQHFVHKMEKNIADMENRDKYNSAFSAWPGNQGRALDASFLVLAAGQWTLSASTPWALPQAFQLAIDRFRMWFLSQREYASKKLDWIVSESTAE
ncbi:cullin, putative, partial [Bodo saltans]